MQPNLPFIRIGRYKIQSEYGRGGMAIVLLGYDPSFERQVAIKVLTQTLLHDPQLRTRFEREAKMIAMLEHPAIVPVYDVGEENGQPYIVMRFMSGGSLAEKLRVGPLSFTEAVQIISRLAPALDAAHAKGIIHRDLKPGNILFDQYGNAFLSDFGIARLTEQSATLTGDSLLGTPAYMSPEQVQGNKELDQRSDIYSLGIILFEMLSGILPYHGDTPARTMMMHILDPIPSLLERKPDVPSYCEEVVFRALAKNPDERYGSASEMAAALEKLIEEGVHKRPTLLPSESDAQTVSIAPLPISDRQTPLKSRPQPRSTVVVRRPGAEPAPVQPTAVPPGAAPPVGRKTGVKLLAIAMFAVIVLGLLAAVGGVYLAGRQGIGPLAQLVGPPAAVPSATQAPTPVVPASATPTATVDLAATAAAGRQATAEAALIATADFEAALTATAGVEAMAATATPTTPPTEIPTVVPSETPTEIPSAPVVGGADRIAFIANNDVWVMNVDGTGLVQLSQDGALKTGLQWSPDGAAVLYLTGSCVNSITLSSGKFDIIACFQPPNTLEEFEVAPDGSQVAISLNHELFVVPYDLPLLLDAQKKSDLEAMAECPALAPYAIHGSIIAVNSVRWSKDTNRLAIVRQAPSEGIKIDLVHVLDISNCFEEIPRLDEFPGVRFKLYVRDVLPEIQNLAWDGEDLFAMFSSKRNGGFGDLWIYNTDLHKADLISPIENTCCYRDPQFSPDGRYLVFVFQNLRLAPNSPIQLYFIPSGTLGSGLAYAPLPLPEGFFSDPRSRPEPVLRPAK